MKPFLDCSPRSDDDWLEMVCGDRSWMGIEEGTAANYQPARTLVVRTDKANQERFELYGNGLVYDKLGRVVTGQIKPGTRVRIFYTYVSPTQRTVDRVELQE